MDDKSTQSGKWLAAFIYVPALILFWPLLQWLASNTLQSEQLLHALGTLGLVAALLGLESPARIEWRFRHDRQSMGLLFASLATMGISILLLPWVVLYLASFSLLLASFARFAFSHSLARISQAVLAAFTLFLFIVLLMPWFDWPLRQLAGTWSASILGALGHQTLLGLTTTYPPELILQVDGKPFLVAAECNGFGLLSASLLLSLVLLIYRRVRLLDKLLLLAVTIGIAFASNLLRIIIIVLLAPHTEHYMLMHEIVGLITFYGALAFLWWLLRGFGESVRLAA